jgi:hypothetical protein
VLTLGRNESFALPATIGLAALRRARSRQLDRISAKRTSDDHLRTPIKRAAAQRGRVAAILCARSRDTTSGIDRMDHVTPRAARSSDPSLESDIAMSK